MTIEQARATVVEMQRRYHDARVARIQAEEAWERAEDLWRRAQSVEKDAEDALRDAKASSDSISPSG